MLTKRPDTLDSFNDADVDDYSTQDDGGESTEPESAQGHTMYFGGQEEGSDQYQVSEGITNGHNIDPLMNVSVVRLMRWMWRS